MSDTPSDPGSEAQPWTPPVQPVPIPDITTLLQAFADPVRMAIVRDLGRATEDRACGSFSVPVTKSTLSHHFRVLLEAGIIDKRHEGTRKLISLRREALDAVYPGLLDSVLRAAEASTPPLPSPVLA
jgi:DNA-binding transcriptional ArsR family regulator